MPAEHVAVSGAAARGSLPRPRTLAIPSAQGLESVRLELDRGRVYRAATDATSRLWLLARLTALPGVQVVPRDGGLIANLGVADNLVLPLRWLKDTDPGSALARAQRWLMELGIDPVRCTALGDAMPEALTPFECRAVAWARALLLNPEVLVLDRLFEGLRSREQPCAARARSVFQRAYPFRTTLFIDDDADAPAVEPGDVLLDLRMEVTA
jgi:ABC-type uncharacterized transport system YnjBCD ATPase subunit